MLEPFIRALKKQSKKALFSFEYRFAPIHQRLLYFTRILDHVSGLIINSPRRLDQNRLCRIAPAMKMMQNHYFNDQTWANFGDEGLGNP